MKARVRAEETHCAWCGRWVDQTLDGNHPDGPVVDHIIERVAGGPEIERDNLTLMHRRCNGEKEARRASRGRKGNQGPYSRDW